MKSLFFKMGLVLSLLVSWVVYDRWDSWTAKTDAVVSSVSQKVKSSLPTEPQTNVTTQVYKWKDAQGRWQFSNEPPKTTAKVSTETYNSNQNVMQRLTNADLVLAARNNKVAQTEKAPSAVGVFSALPNAVNGARDAQESAQQHNEQLQQTLQAN